MKRILNKLISGLVISSSIAGVLTSCSNTEIKKYVVTFNTNGGTALNSIEVLEGGKINPPGEPTKENHLFCGWYEDEALTKAFDFTQPINNDINLYAKWAKHETQFVVVSDYCDSTGQEDCADIIQSLIDNNPNKTLFFKDGTYILSHPIKTYSDPTKSVSLLLSGYAILKASEEYQVKRDESYVKKSWEDDYNYMVQLGIDRNKSRESCANFFLKGGIIDGNGKAAGIELVGGLEDEISNVNIKGTEIGVRIAPGVNGSASADVNVHNLNVRGNNSDTSIGLLCVAHDNMFSDIRISHTHTGVRQEGGNNYYTNIHCTAGDLTTQSYNTSVGFWFNSINFLKNCYSDCYHTGFDVNGKLFCDSCVAWFNKTSSLEADIAINHHTNFNSYFYNFTCRFVKHVDETVINKVFVLADGKQILNGKIYNIIIGGRNTLSDEDLYKQILEGFDIDY